LLARLGLRAVEVARLRLDDLDWRAGQIVVDGKAHRRDRLPLPGDVGEAIVSICGIAASGAGSGACS
jgi:integrase/recombinase XerD